VEPKIEWYNSGIIRQQIVMVIVGVLGLFGVTTDIDVDATVATVFAAIAVLVPIYTIVTRLFKPTPPITETAVNKERSMKASGALK